VQFRVDHNYERSANAVFAALTDFDRVRDKYEALGHDGVELVSRDVLDDGGVSLVTRRVVPLELPGFAKKFLSPRQSVTQTDTWSAPDGDGVRHGTFAVVGKGTPVQVHGTMRLAPMTARRCTNVTDVTVECKIPLLGGKIADFVADSTRRAVDHEQVWMRAHLSTR
jgi:hypothetical protein